MLPSRRGIFMSDKLLKRLEKEWNNAGDIKGRLAIITLYAQYCDVESVGKLKKFREYFDEDLLINASITELTRITRTLRGVSRRIAVLSPVSTAGGRAFKNKLSPADKRRAARTLDHHMVRGLTNRYLESDSGPDTRDEFRDDLLDT